MHALRHKRDFYAGGLMMLFGLFMALNGPSYRLGTLMHMGPGFMPTVLGVVLTLLGIFIALSAIASPDVPGKERILPGYPQWRGWFCILAGPVLLIICGSYGGLISATFACVFISAFGDRTTTWKQALVLAAGFPQATIGIGLWVFGKYFADSRPRVSSS